MDGQPLGGPLVLAGVAQPGFGFSGGACHDQALGHRLYFAGQRRKETQLR